MFDNVKEMIEELSDTSCSAEKLADNSNKLSDLANLLQKTYNGLTCIMPPYPNTDHEQEMWDAIYHDTDDFIDAFYAVIVEARKQEKFTDSCIREAEEEDERKYGDYETQVREYYYSTR